MITRVRKKGKKHTYTDDMMRIEPLMSLLPVMVVAVPLLLSLSLGGDVGHSSYFVLLWFPIHMRNLLVNNCE